MIDNSILISMYKDEFRSLHCQVCRGETNIAKPLVVLAMLILVHNKKPIENKFEISDIKEIYEELQNKYGTTTPYQYPLYFLENESFYHLKWVDQRIKTHTPSSKLVRENVLFAYFDNALWDLLQDDSLNDLFQTIIKDNYLN